MRQKGFAPIIIVIFIVLVGILGYVAYNNYVSPKGTILGPYLPSPIATVTPDLTANWKTYKSSKYGFELKYASDLKLDDTSSISVILLDPNNSDNYFSVTPSNVLSVTFPIENWVKIQQEKWKNCVGKGCVAVGRPEYLGKTIVNGLTLYEVSKDASMYDVNYYLLSKDGKYFTLTTSILEDGSAIGKEIGQILSTFKFTQ